VGSQYAKLELMAGQGRNDSYVTLALCVNHLGEFGGVEKLNAADSDALLNQMRELDLP
jgi:hypothetical protein